MQYFSERWERPGKYKFIEHAERNAIYAASRVGRFISGLTMVSPWAACSDCARGIIQAGIIRLVRHKQASDRSSEFWLEEIRVADMMLREANVEIVDVDWTFGDIEVRHSGELWHP